MKKLFTISIALSCIALYASAQFVTISETHQLPAFGDTIHYVDANTFGFDPTGVGPVTAKIWDESLLLNTGSFYNFFYVDPDSITGFGVDSFPTATIARGESGAPGYFYYQNTTNDINRIGWFGGTNNYGIYENGTFATEFHFPITAGNTVNTTYNGRYSPFNLGEDSVKIELGSLTINADAQGILLLPTGTFTNVLRIHVLENFHIVTYLFGFPAQDNFIQDDYFYWFHDTILQPVLVSGVTTIDGNPGTPVLRYQPISTPTGIATNSVQTANIYPSLSKGKFNIRISEERFADYNLDIFNALGERIHYIKSKHSNSDEIDISNSPKGIYFIKIYSGQNIRTEKIIIQ